VKFKQIVPKEMLARLAHPVRRADKRRGAPAAAGDD
jgi:hypothetical protein